MAATATMLPTTNSAKMPRTLPVATKTNQPMTKMRASAIEIWPLAGSSNQKKSPAISIVFSADPRLQIAATTTMRIGLSIVFKTPVRSARSPRRSQ